MERPPDHERFGSTPRRAGPETLLQLSSRTDRLKAEGREDEADRLIESSVQIYPDEPELLRQAGWSAMARKEWRQAILRWERARAIHPKMLEAYVEAALAFRALGEPLEAEHLLQSGVARFPDDSRAYWQFAHNAELMGKWAVAQARWRAFCAAFPQDLAGPVELQRVNYEYRFQAVGRSSLDVDGAPAHRPAGTVPDEIAAMEPKAILDRFESLGENCEFGFVQRHFGSEPLSLLRWGSMPFDTMLSGLANGFEGLGDPAYLSLNVSEGRELIVSDSRYLSGLHTHVYADSVDKVQFLNEMARRLDFFRRKLISDLTAGVKIFVYKPVSEGCEDQPLKLLAALRRYGDVRLLWVSDAAAGRTAGAVELVGADLARTFIPAVRWPLQEAIAYDCWLAATSTALSLLSKPSAPKSVVRDQGAESSHMRCRDGLRKG